MQEQPPDYNKGQPEVGYGYAPPPQAGYSPGYGHVVHSQPGTTVVVQQPQIITKRGWNSGVFDCCDDAAICLCGTFCGLCLACQVSTDMGESLCVPCCVQQAVTVLRTKWRTQNNIEGSIMNDCILDAFCGPCALCQLAREVKTARANGTYRPT